MLQQQEALKRAITQQRPLGSQLDSCRAAVERAEKRRGECQAAHAKAGQALDQANLDLANDKLEIPKLLDATDMVRRCGRAARVWVRETPLREGGVGWLP